MAIAHPAAAVPRDRTRPGSTATGALVALSIAVTLVIIYALWEFWPTDAVLKSTTASKVQVFGLTRNVSPDVRLLVVVALAGSLGGLMHSTRSLAWYAGHRGLMWRWVPYYLVTIVLGAGLASIFYLVIRGGVLGDHATTADTNPYGFAAIGALVGLFTEQALEMLRKVANEVFSVVPPGSDAITTTSTQTAATIATGTAGTSAAGGGSATTRTVTNCTATTAVIEGDVAASNGAQCYFNWGTTDSYGETTAAQPVDASNGPMYVSASLENLVPDTPYHFQLVAFDADGDLVARSTDSTFTTTSA
jgi:hypothetical protein